MKLGTKKNDHNVFEKIDEIKRQVASVNASLDQVDDFQSQQKVTDLKKIGNTLGEMHLETDSSVRSLIQTNCDFENLEKTVTSSQIKFDFMDCENSGALMKLINKTNGYEAQIFGIRGKKVSSDFIQLEQGPNELVFEISSTAGQIKSQTIKIKRIQ